MATTFPAIYKMMLFRQLYAPTLLLVLTSMCLASANTASTLPRAGLAVREHQLWHPAVHDSEYAALQGGDMNPNCEATQMPQALTTPDPLLQAADKNSKVTVSFIIGTDGKVQSPLILDGTGNYGYQSLLSAVRSWRYRPGLCNGVPMEVEATVEFSRR
jgi:TonB family protein